MIARIAILALAMASVGATAPAHYRSSPERRVAPDAREWAAGLGAFPAKLIPVMMQDFGERYLYRDANRALPPPRAGEQRVVFMGDSITDGWNLAQAFPGRPYVNRGVGAQVTAQMLVRFRQDVVALRPRAVVILAGTNDVPGTLQQETPETIVENITAMTDIARANGIAVVLCALLPVNNYTANARTMLEGRPPAVLRDVNRRLRALATERGYAFADYDAGLRDDRGLLTAELTGDGLHPNAAGYARMAPIVGAAIDRTLRRK